MWMSKFIKAKATGIDDNKYLTSLDDKTREKVESYADVFKGTKLQGNTAQEDHFNMKWDKSRWQGKSINGDEIDAKLGRDREGISRAKDDSARIEAMFTASSNSLKQAKGRSGSDQSHAPEWDAASGSFGGNNQKSNVVEFKAQAAEKEASRDVSLELER